MRQSGSATPPPPASSGVSGAWTPARTPLWTPAGAILDTFMDARLYTPRSFRIATIKSSCVIQT